MNKKLTLGSLFDGSGGFPLGGLLSGITPVWASEIEPFPIMVTSRRLPFMKHYGDISQMHGGEIEPVDIITFGSPCTDMSIAGRRAGLEGKQSVLFYEAIRIIKEMRCKTNGKYPRWICWENVPGAFSSNKGEDFRAVLEAIIGVVCEDAQVPMPEKNRWPYADLYMGDGWSLAYRTLDAQYWGVPQRRRRIYLVADFAGGSAGEILFESEGVSGYSAEGFRAWQRAARGASPCAHAAGFDGYNGQLTGDVSATLGVNCGMSTGRNGIVLNDQGGSRMDVTDEVTCTLRAESHHPPCVMDTPAVIPLEHHPTDSRIKIEESNAIQTLTSRMGTGGNNVPLVMSDEDAPVTLKIRSGCEGGGKGALLQENKSATLSCNNDQTVFVPKAYGICSKDSNGMKSSNPHVGFYETDTARTLDVNGGNPACNQGGIAVVAFAQNQRNEVRDLGEKSAVVCANAGTKQQTYVLQDHAAEHDAIYAMTTGSFAHVAEDAAPTLMARDFKDPTAVCYGIGRDTFNQGRNSAFSPTFDEELQPTLVAKGPSAVQSGYIVRRLTPTECARLQGFADWWCSDLGVENPSEEEIDRWAAVFKTYRQLTDASKKPKTRKQIAKWLKDPYADAAEYKMWGNGVALPCVYFVLSGIVWAAEKG
ncbi:MAG: DNA cytosine methyltransferase [Anaerovoracaceae bacterium]